MLFLVCYAIPPISPILLKHNLNLSVHGNVSLVRQSYRSTSDLLHENSAGKFIYTGEGLQALLSARNASFLFQDKRIFPQMRNDSLFLMKIFHVFEKGIRPQ